MTAPNKTLIASTKGASVLVAPLRIPRRLRAWLQTLRWRHDLAHRLIATEDSLQMCVAQWENDARLLTLDTSDDRAYRQACRDHASDVERILRNLRS